MRSIGSDAEEQGVMILLDKVFDGKQKKKVFDGLMTVDDGLMLVNDGLIMAN